MAVFFVVLKIKNIYKKHFILCHNSTKNHINFINNILYLCGGIMFKVYYSRAESFAQYIIDNGATIRQTAKKFNYSKSLVHNDVSNKLKHINLDLYFAVKK